jgi:hypothetical protein
MMRRAIDRADGALLWKLPPFRPGVAVTLLVDDDEWLHLKAIDQGQQRMAVAAA